MTGRKIPRLIRKIAQVRSEYTSARLISSNLEHRAAGTRFERAPGYLPAEIDYVTADGALSTLFVRDYDVRYLDRVSLERATDHLQWILRARRGDREAQRLLGRRTEETWRRISARFAGTALIETDEVIPYTTSRSFSEVEISNKGSILLDLSGYGFATADFCLLAAKAHGLPPDRLEKCLRNTIRNLEILSGRKLGDPENPLLIAMRSALPEYLPGFMPTYLNVGLIPEMLPGLPRRYGEEAALRIRLSNRKTILEALDPEAFRDIERQIHPDRTMEENIDLISSIEALIKEHDPRLLTSAYKQIRFFLAKTYAYYEGHLDALRNFMVRETHHPTVIFQRMVCSVIDRESYAGVLYSRHPRLGTGVLLQFARTIYGEDLMTGRLPAEERYFQSREETREEFPAVYHFWNRLAQLEEVFRLSRDGRVHRRPRDIHDPPGQPGGADRGGDDHGRHGHVPFREDLRGAGPGADQALPCPPDRIGQRRPEIAGRSHPVLPGDFGPAAVGGLGQGLFLHRARRRKREAAKRSS